MPRSGSKATKTFSGASELEFVEIELAKWTLCLGLGSDLDNITIDEIVSSARNQWWVTSSNFTGAANDLCREAFLLCVANVRRLWHRRQIALAVVNG
jgi:hypothetical protein